MLKTLFNPDISVSGKKIFFSSTVFFLLLSAPCLAGEWNLTGSLNQGSEEFSSVILNDGRVLKAGASMPSDESRICEIWDPATGLWTLTDSMTFGREGYDFLVKLPDGRVLATGFGGPNCMSEIWDPATGLWTSAGEMNYLHEDHCSILFINALGDTCVLAIAGDLENNYRGCEIWNPTTESWSPTGFLPIGKRCFSAILLPNGDVMAVGGGITGYDACAIYDHTTGVWTAIASLNQGRLYLTLELLNNGNPMIIAGVYGNIFLSSCEIYDFQTEEWNFTDSLEIGRTGHCSEKLLNNKILVMGGQGGTGSGSGYSCEIYKPITNLWQTTTSLYHSYGNFSSEILEDERVLAIRSWCEIYTWNYTPVVSQPQGVNQGALNDILTFSITATDPDNDSIAVRIDWGDNEISEWSQLVPSGTTLELSHSWTEPGVYQVRAQVADQWYFLNEECHNSLSEWGDTLIVTITPGPSIDPSYNPELAIRICPNPFSTSVTISFQETTNLHENSRIEIYNIKGQMVKTFISFPNGDLGAREVLWDGRDDTGEPVVSGIYFCTLKMGDNEISCKKIVFLK